MSRPSILEHASNNPKAYYKQRVTVEDVLASRMICKPLHLLDCCVETDNGNCIIVTSMARAKDCRHPAAQILGVVGRCSKPRVDNHYQSGPISTVAGVYAKDILWPNAGVGPEDIQVTGSYDAFTFTTMLQLEDYGFCKKGEGGDYVSSGTMRLGNARPNNTSGGHLCEGYTHGIAMVIENVRQLRHDVDDSCPIARTASVYTPTITRRAAVGKCATCSFPPISAGPRRPQQRASDGEGNIRWHCTANISAMPVRD